MKKIVASILLACMALSMVACSSSTTSTTTTTTTDSASTTTTTEATTTTEEVDTNPYGLKADGIYSCSDEPIELSIFSHYLNVYVLTDGQEIPAEVTKYTNITIRGAASEYSGDSAQAFNLIMASKTLPDLVGGTTAALGQYGMEGAFIPLNDLIDEYAPNIAAVFEEFPDIKAAVTSEDGNIYAIPFIYESQVSQAWFIRQDWLDILDLEIPTTVDELYDVFTAFRNEDPNGNGEKDEIPFFTRLTSTDNRLASLFALQGISDFLHTDENGTVGIGAYSEEWKDAVTVISQWYAEGLIDTEIFTRDDTARDILFPDNNGGATHDWIPSTSAYNDSMTAYVDDFYLSAMLPPADIYGDVWEADSRKRVTGNGTGISVDCEYPVEAMKLLDFYFSDQGRLINTYGIEGETFYYDENGEIKYTDELMNGDTAVNIQIYNMGGMMQTLAYLHDASYENLIMHEEGALCNDMYFDVTGAKNPQLPTVSLTLEESDLITSKWSTIRAYMLEKLQTWVFDGSRIEAEFDDYMQALRDMGVEEVLAAYQAAYDRAIELGS